MMQLNNQGVKSLLTFVDLYGFRDTISKKIQAMCTLHSSICGSLLGPAPKKLAIKGHLVLLLEMKPYGENVAKPYFANVILLTTSYKCNFLTNFNYQYIKLVHTTSPYNQYTNSVQTTSPYNQDIQLENRTTTYIQ